MGLMQYKYYFRKPKSALVKDILSWVLIGGLITIAATSPYFLQNLIRGYKRWKKYPKRKISAAFYILKKEGLLEIQNKNGQIFISLTPEGRMKAGMFQINHLKIARPKTWDRKWRLLTFDISEKKKIIREALRGKLKGLGFQSFQKSIWLYPFDCTAEIDLLKRFFGLSDNEVELIVASHIGKDEKWRNIFKLST